MHATPEPAPDQPPSAPPPTAEMLAPRVWVHPDDLDFTFSRSSGPGGQSVNKVSSAARLRVRVEAIKGLDPRAQARLRRLAGQRHLAREDELLIDARTHRSQLDNRRECVNRLSDLVRRAVVVPKKRRPTRPSKGSVERRLESKRQRSQRKSRRNWRPRDD